MAGFLRIAWQLCTGLGGRNHRNTQGVPRCLEIRPPGAAWQLFQRVPQLLVVHLLDTELLPQRREVELLIPQLDAGNWDDKIELPDALGVEQQHAEGLQPLVQVSVDEAFYRRAGRNEHGHLPFVEVA